MFVGMALYGLGLVARAYAPEPYATTAWFALTLLGLILLVGWFFAVRRGFRVRWVGRAKSRRKKGRKARSRFAPPRRP